MQAVSEAMTIQRTRAFGDVIAATAIATHLKKQGHSIRFQTDKLCAEMLEGHPDIDEIAPSNSGPVDVDLGDIDKAQETAHLQTCYAEIAAKTLNQPIENFPLIVPKLHVTDDERAAARRQMGIFPRPWVHICPGSWQAPNRTVSNDTWQKVAEAFPEMAFFTAVNAPVGGRVNQVGNMSFRGLMAVIAECDFQLTTDSGPMHVAASFQVPQLVIEQSWPIALRIPDCPHIVMHNTGLPCSPCRKHVCPLKNVDVAFPPCQGFAVDGIIVGARELFKRTQPAHEFALLSDRKWKKK